ncbi:MAG: phospholipase D family protein [Actinomycetota bacterium]
MGAARDAIDKVDKAFGNTIEKLERDHHARRLRRLGHAASLEPPAGAGLWAAADPPPREGNDLQVLIDGQHVFSEIVKALKGAKSYVHIAGWHLEPDFQLARDGERTSVREILADLAERVDVRVLLWAGPPVPAFRPTRAMIRAVRDELTAGTRIRCVLDSRERTMHCHHEKLVIVDGDVAFVGGVDLTSLSGDRWDTNRHEPRSGIGWHDAATQMHGPIVADVAQHFRQRWQEAAGEPLPTPVAPPPAGEIQVQLLRTVPERVYKFSPRGEFGILEGYLRALRSAQHFVYLENQFLWSTEIAGVIMEKLRNPPSDTFRVLLMLPAKPNDGADTTRGQLGALIEADNHAGRLLAVTTHSHSGDRTGPVYVHAKIGIVDDKWLTVGSANLNEHSLLNDTEINVATCDAELARGTRRRLWSEHLVLPVEEVAGDPTTVIDELWRPIAEEQLARRKQGLQQTHRLMELPAVSRRAKRLIGPMKGLLVDG